MEAARAEADVEDARNAAYVATREEARASALLVKLQEICKKTTIAAVAAQLNSQAKADTASRWSKEAAQPEAKENIDLQEAASAAAAATKATAEGAHLTSIEKEKVFAAVAKARVRCAESKVRSQRTIRPLLHAPCFSNHLSHVCERHVLQLI